MRIKSKEIKRCGVSPPGFCRAGRQCLSRACLVPCDSTVRVKELALSSYLYYNQSGWWALRSIWFKRWWLFWGGGGRGTDSTSELPWALSVSGSLGKEFLSLPQRIWFWLFFIYWHDGFVGCGVVGRAGLPTMCLLRMVKVVLQRGRPLV